MDSFSTLSTLSIEKQDFLIYDLNCLPNSELVGNLPYSLRILLENLLRCEDGRSVNKDQIQALLNWKPKDADRREISFTPARVLLQDFTGVPAIVDLAAMRTAMEKLGGDPKVIEPLVPAELVVDHSIMVDFYNKSNAIAENVKVDYERNQERYEFLNWGQQAFSSFKVVPPNTGIVHQVNLEYLARVCFAQNTEDGFLLYPDTLVGTDSHTTMINGLGVLGWGVGGIEAEAAMLGQPSSMLLPDVIGVRVKGSLRVGVTATDLVLHVTQMLRSYGVVGKFVEFFGEGLARMSIADRATIANMAPEYGATCGFFPIDEQTLKYMKLTARPEAQIKVTRAYAMHQGLFFDKNAPEPNYTDVLELDLTQVVPCVAGPKRPQDKTPLPDVPSKVQEAIQEIVLSGKATQGAIAEVSLNGCADKFENGSIAIAAITSCTNTSNPHLMIAAALVAKNALDKGMKVPCFVKTSLAPGSQVVKAYLEKSNLLPYLEKLGFGIVGYGCTTCIGNSGPLAPEVSKVINDHQLVATAVLSGNRNFEGRIHPQVRYSFLASPPLVVAYALAGTMNIDLSSDPIGMDTAGHPVYLKDLWPSAQEIENIAEKVLAQQMFIDQYKTVFHGDERWRAIQSAKGALFRWKDDSTYIKKPPYFDDMKLTPSALGAVKNARCLALFGDSITTDHISPAGNIATDSPAGRYLQERGVERKDFNSYGSRRGHDEVMIRGTFANPRLKNKLVAPTEGGWSKHFPSGEIASIFDVSTSYQKDDTPLIILAGKEYGSGSSRDWAAKGTKLLGVKAVLAESFERIHRSNLIGMGILPLQFKEGESIASLKLSGEEDFSFDLSQIQLGKPFFIEVAYGEKKFTIEVKVRLETPLELEYLRHDGILPYMLRELYHQHQEGA